MVSDDRVALAQSFKERLHKELALGMTRHVCRYGTLSDGHEKITPAQRYYQAIKEMYTRGVEIANQECNAMEAQADLIDAKEQLKATKSKSGKLRAKAAVKRAKTRLVTTLISIEDTMRQLDEFDTVRKELEAEVTQKYPQGIEQAERDNWIAVAEYRAALRQMGQAVNLTHVPLDQDDKARLGFQNNAPDMAAWLLVDKKEEIIKKNGGDFKAYAIDRLGVQPKAITGGR